MPRLRKCFAGIPACEPNTFLQHWAAQQSWRASRWSRSLLETPEKFKLDENVPELVRESLIEVGHDAHTDSEEGLAGFQDERVLQANVAEDGILMTLNPDFSRIRGYPPGSYPEIRVLRPPKQATKVGLQSNRSSRTGVRLFTVERVRGQLRVIDEERVNIRDNGA